MKKEVVISLSTILFVIALLVFVPVLCDFGSWGANLISNFVSKLINIF